MCLDGFYEFGKFVQEKNRIFERPDCKNKNKKIKFSQACRLMHGESVKILFVFTLKDNIELIRDKNLRCMDKLFL